MLTYFKSSDELVISRYFPIWRFREFKRHAEPKDVFRVTAFDVFDTDEYVRRRTRTDNGSGNVEKNLPRTKRILTSKSRGAFPVPAESPLQFVYIDRTTETAKTGKIVNRILRAFNCGARNRNVSTTV